MNELSDQNYQNKAYGLQTKVILFHHHDQLTPKLLRLKAIDTLESFDHHTLYKDDHSKIPWSKSILRVLQWFYFEQISKSSNDYLRVLRVKGFQIIDKHFVLYVAKN